VFNEERQDYELCAVAKKNSRKREKADGGSLAGSILGEMSALSLISSVRTAEFIPSRCTGICVGDESIFDPGPISKRR